jgi:endonuclease/exonuclease/phosphatase family metal-dependent hydrolase
MNRDAAAIDAAPAESPPASARRLRLLSFNIQAGATTESYREYFTRGWQHVLPHPTKVRNLAQVAKFVAGFDLVALQEADAGSLRSGFRNQIQHLAESAGFPYWSHQSNRRVARIAEPSNGVLMRMQPTTVLDHRLPGTIGRGALEVRFGENESGLHVYIAHLSLTPRARRTQLEYLSTIIGEHPYVVLMGDLNCTPESGELKPLFKRGHLVAPRRAPCTFPSWQPERAIDHILVSRALTTVTLEAPAIRVSDHLPLALELDLPPGCRI